MRFPHQPTSTGDICYSTRLHENLCTQLSPCLALCVIICRLGNGNVTCSGAAQIGKEQVNQSHVELVPSKTFKCFSQDGLDGHSRSLQVFSHHASE